MLVSSGLARSTVGPENPPAGRTRPRRRPFPAASCVPRRSGPEAGAVDRDEALKWHFCGAVSSHGPCGRDADVLCRLGQCQVQWQFQAQWRASQPESQAAGCEWPARHCVTDASVISSPSCVVFAIAPRISRPKRTVAGNLESR